MNGHPHRLKLTKSESAALNKFITDAHRLLGSDLLNVTLFGSRARREGTRESDLDLLIVLEKADAATTQSVRFIAADATLALGPEVSTRVWSRARLEAEQARPGGLFRNILRDGVPLWDMDAACPQLEPHEATDAVPA